MQKLQVVPVTSAAALQIHQNSRPWRSLATRVVEAILDRLWAWMRVTQVLDVMIVTVLGFIAAAAAVALFFR